MKLQLTIKMLSDWHVGCGSGQRGEIDRLIQRDADGLPYIPAKTLTGIWRDACELVANGLDADESDRSQSANTATWSQWVEYLFGEQPALVEGAIDTAPRHAALSVRAAHFPEELRSLLQNRHAALRSAITFVKPGISIDADDGCAREDFLRFEEMVRLGTILHATGELDLQHLTAQQQQTACTLLSAGARLVERLGGKRRRGAGQCTLQLTWLGKTPQITWDTLNRSAPPLPQVSYDSNTKELDSDHASVDWIRIALTLEAQTPIVISARTIGNVVETLDYVPGTHLLRIVLQRLRSLHLDLSNAVGMGDLLLTNALPSVGEQPGRPVPTCLFYEKLEGGFAKGGKVYNRFQEKEPDSQLKGYRGGYIHTENSVAVQPIYDTVKTLIGTHNTIQDTVQRPTSDVGGVYSYEAIAPKTFFHAELRLRRSIHEALRKKHPNWWKLLEGQHRIGQSKKDDYGAIQLTAKEMTGSFSVSAVPSELTVWILSDVLLRDKRLRPSTSLEDFQAALTNKLNEGRSPDELIQLELRPSNLEVLSAMVRSHRIESWQVRWNLPRPSLVGLAAGSCMVFDVTSGSIDPQQLTALELAGIGERRAEGYGQLCFNHHLLCQSLSSKEQAEKIEGNSKGKAQSQTKLLRNIEKDRSIYEYARLIEKAAWREAIRRAALFLASKPESREAVLGIRITQNSESGLPKSHPSMSQLGALRSVIAQVRSPNSNNAVTRWISGIREKKSDRWDQTAQGLDKSMNLGTNQAAIWQQIDQALNNSKDAQNSLNYPSLQNLTLTQDGDNTLKKELWAETVQIVVDACIRAHKRDLEPSYSTKEPNLIETGAAHGT